MGYTPNLPHLYVAYNPLILTIHASTSNGTSKYLLRWVWGVFCGSKYTLQGTNISPKHGILKMIFLFPRWDMLVPRRVFWTSVLVFACYDRIFKTASVEPPKKNPPFWDEARTAWSESVLWSSKAWLFDWARDRDVLLFPCDSCSVKKLQGSPLRTLFLDIFLNPANITKT